MAYMNTIVTWAPQDFIMSKFNDSDQEGHCDGWPTEYGDPCVALKKLYFPESTIPFQEFGRFDDLTRSSAIWTRPFSF